jgi:AcrR family transcriptional regulator
MKDTAAEALPTPRKTGRPLSFDRAAALEKAMLTFWRHGYETTSITDLTTAMGVTAPSLYTAFGDKKQLFMEAMHRYADERADMAKKIDAAPTAREAAQDMLIGAATAFTGKTTPKGCLLASATASCSADAMDVQRAVSKIRDAIGAMLRARIERDIAAGVLPATTPAATLSALVMAVIQGMSVLARDGATRARLIDVGKAALGAWPGAV